MSEPRSTRSSAPEGPLLVDPIQAAEMLSISPRKLWSETAAGRIPVVRIGRCTRYDLRDLIAYIDASKSGGAR